MGVLCTDETVSSYKADGIKSLENSKDMTDGARNLFRLLREFNVEKVHLAIAEWLLVEGLDWGF